jgi:tetratricopeptide (TPR) repeat protein
MLFCAKLRKLALFSALAAVPLFAAGPWPLDYFTSDPKAALEAAQKIPVPDGVDLFVLDYQIRCRVEADGRQSTLVRTLLRVITDAGAKQMSQHSAPWLAWRQSKPAWKARVITADGAAHPLDPATITEAGIPNQEEGVFTDTKVLAAPLPAVAKNSLIELETNTADREAVGSPSAILPIHLATAHFEFSLDAPENAAFHFATRGLKNVQRKDTRDTGRRRITLEGADVAAVRPLDLAPPEMTTPAIIFSTAQDWNQVARWYWDLAEPQIAEKQPAPADPSAHIAEIAAILAEIQKTVRYTGIEFGMSAYVPRTPKETLARGFGDCKDKSALLVSRLRHAGIAANLALLTPYPTADVSLDVPGAGMFDHAIVYLPGAHPFYIDPTSEFTAAGRLPQPDQGRMTLIIDPSATTLARTPESSLDQNRELAIFNIRLADEGKAAVAFEQEESGGIEEYWRTAAAAWLDLPESRRTGQVNKPFEQQLNAEKIANIDWGNPHDLSGPYRMTVNAEAYRNSGSTDQLDYAYVPKFERPPTPISILLAQYAADDPKKRTEDYDLLHPFTAEERWRVIPPSGFKLRNLPDAKDVDLGPLTLHRKITLEPDGSALAVYRIESPGHRFTVAQAKQIAEAFKQPDARAYFRFDFMPEGAQLMSEGKWKEAIDLLRRDAASDPPRPGPLLRYAAALLQVGLRDEAAQACRKAIDADPKSAHAWAILGNIMRHDPVGRIDRPGMDLAEADRDIQKAIELDPKNKRYIVDRALIREFDDSGERYQDPQRLAEAITLLEGVATDLPAIQQQNVLAEALLHARRFADLKALFEKPEGRDARNDFLVAAIAGADGSAAALREARNLQPDDAAYKSLLQSSGRDLENSGEYAKAADLLEAAGNSASTVTLFRHAGRHGALPLSKDPVIAEVERYIFATCDREYQPKYDEMLVPEWKILTWQAQRSQIVAFFSAYRNVAGISLGTRSTADVVVGNVEFLKDGDDATGYRVRFADPSANGAIKTIAWVVRRGDDYKILSLRNDEAPVGGEILALAQKGNLEAARKWLDWTHEEITPSTSSDLLASQPFMRLWPTEQDPPSKDQILTATATLITRGHYAREGVDLLKTLRDKASTDAQRQAIDQSIALGLIEQSKFAEAIPAAEAVFKSRPSSAAALTLLGDALVLAGHSDQALKLADSTKSANDAEFIAIAHLITLAHQARQEYAQAIESDLVLINTKKAAAGDWNSAAWLSLFAPGKIAPDLKSAETAVRMTQDRNLPAIHTLACVQAELGKLKEARDGLLRYLGTSATISTSGWYLEGRIAEALGLTGSAAAIYSNIAKPARLTGSDAWDLAQIRLAVIQSHAPR